jgi:hypothetical protein
MNVLLKAFFRGISGFFGKKHTRRLMYLCILGIAAYADFLYLGLVRRTFVFYAVKDGAPVVEDRMFSRTESAEGDIARYVEEVLLGPVSLEAAPLFPKETKLRALLYREGVVYADLSAAAALPVPEGGGLWGNLDTLNQGIRRNFSFVQDVKLFVEGHEVFFEKIFSDIGEK